MLFTVLPAWVLLAVFAILYLQSGIDKVIDWAGNVGWLKEHFGKTFLKNSVPALLGIVTLVELVAGLLCLIGFVAFPFAHALGMEAGYLGLFVGLINLTMLFFGQRVAKDYAGTASLAVYLALTLLTMRWVPTMDSNVTNEWAKPHKVGEPVSRFVP